MKPTLSELSDSDPEYLVARQDSLIATGEKNEQVLAALINAHLNLAERASAASDWEKAYNEYQDALKLDTDNRQIRFELLMVDGHRLYKKGSPTSLWEALERYGSAAILKPLSGEPHYWMARAYEKKDDRDFDLILEAYDRALTKTLSDSLRADAVQHRSRAAERKAKMDAFWR